MHATELVPRTALLTDLYQLTMAFGYWKSGTADKRAVFNFFFRKHPFNGGFTVACGLMPAIEFLRGLRFEPGDLAYLGGLKGRDGKPLFDAAFLDYLKGLEFQCDVDAVPEGTIVFPQEPMVRVTGPILQAQLVETALLYIINFQTLIATKAARVCLAASGGSVIEFGLRRAQGSDGGVAVSRAAYVGGCAGTSNVLAAKTLGIPALGTHAHSWVMSFDSEVEAFEAYAEALPNNCVFLVDTYDSLEGVRNAVKVGRKLRARGHDLAGIRLDSGDLAYLSIEARRILDEAGLPGAFIVASNDLDEHIITSLKQQGARIDVWGVGTKLVTAYNNPALGGVYKVSAIDSGDGVWQHKLKLSEQAVKVTNPGVLQVRRYRSSAEFIGDTIYDTLTPPGPGSVSGSGPGPGDGFAMVDPLDATRRRHYPSDTPYEDLLVPVLRSGRMVCALPELGEVRERVRAQLGMFNSGIKRFTNPHAYPVGLEAALHDLKTRLVLQARGKGRNTETAEMET